MFAFVCNNFNANFAQQMLMLSFKFKSYKNCFDLKNAEMLFIYKNKNHVMDLKFNKKLSYDLLYALSKKDFKFYKIIY